MSRHFVLQYKSKIKQKNPKIYIFFNPKKRTKKFTYQVNLIYLPSKLIYLPSKLNLLTK